MVKKRARISDNDPLNPTDDVLSGLERFSQSSPSTRQPDHQSASTARQQANKSASDSGHKLKKATYQLNSGLLQELDRS